jgi:hypothetical protein
MNDARAAIDGDEIRGHDAPRQVLSAAVLQRALRLPARLPVVVERRPVPAPDQFAAAARGLHVELPFAFGRDGIDERCRDDQPLAGLAVADRGIVQFWVNGGELVVR